MHKVENPTPRPLLMTNSLSLSLSLSLSFLLLILISQPCLLYSQQPYVGVNTDCNSQSPFNLGYSCNGHSRSCQTFLTFNSQPSYQSVSAISSLLDADPSQLAQANSVPENATFANNTKVLVPINCSCSGSYYQSNSSYLVQNDDTVYTIANDVFQGLTTCRAILIQNNINPNNLQVNQQINIPLRCACPTSNQTSNGVKFLLSYLVDPGDTIYLISLSFEVTTTSIEDANEITGSNTDIYPSTTLLIPLEKQPSPSQLGTPSPPPPPPLPPAPTPPPRKSSNHTGVYAGVAVGAVALVSILSLVAFFVAKSKKKKAAAWEIVRSDSFANLSGVSKASEDVLLGISEIGQALKVYKYEELQLATKNFSEESLIEGSVYLGVFNGEFAAVKIISRDVSKEIDILKKLNHFNLVKLSGICFHGGYWYLVYEYAENGSLKSWIFYPSGSKVLSWSQRVQIALDVATGLNYLHSFTVPAYVHKDINCSNILLDGRFRAKIANFWQARATENKEGEFDMTRHIVGTQGYMAPEYLEHGLVSPKLDIYAFGIVMLEMITAKRAVEIQQHALVAGLDEEDDGQKLEKFMDPLLESKYPLEVALVMARLIRWCLMPDAGRRPAMEEVAHSLSKVLASSLNWQESSEPQSFSSEQELLGKL